jgi:hypothetical protein
MMFLYIRHSPFLHQLWGVDYYSSYVKMMGINLIFQPCGELPLPQSLSWWCTYYKEDSLHFFIEANLFSDPHQ